MKENFEKSLKHVLIHEGGFVDHPRDPGGATNKGVTLRTFQRHFGASKTVDDLKNISDAQLGTIYRSGYWDKCKCEELPSGVDYAVFDAAVNSGPGRGAVWLQKAVGATPDGGIGPQTLAKVATHEPLAIVNGVCDIRMDFLRGLRHFDTFGRGWMRRVAGVRQVASEMAGGAALEEGGPIVPNVDFETVRRGSTGEWVVKLQEALGITSDGQFGPQTERALITFQKAHGLEPDGIAGRSTYRALGLID